MLLHLTPQQLVDLTNEICPENIYEPEDLCEEPHPEQRPGEIYLGELHQYRVGGNTPVKDYTTRSAMTPYKTRRLGKGVPETESPFGGFIWPVFASIEETGGFIEL